MPPSSVTVSRARSTAAAAAITPAAAAASANCSSSWPWATAASQAAAVISSVRANSRAHLCLIAWNEPIGTPNCSRTLA